MPRRTRGNPLVPNAPITLCGPLCPAADPLGLIFIVPQGRSSSSYTRIKRSGFNSYRSSSPFTAGPLRFIYVCGLASATCLSSITPSPTRDRFSFRLTRIACDSASRSITMKPRLCGVFSYSPPGFPRPTIRYSAICSTTAHYFLPFFSFSFASPSASPPRLQQRLLLPSCPS